MGSYVIPIPNPERSRQKVPIRLHDKIKETRYPVIGLDYIKEFITVSDPFSGFILSPPMNELSGNYSSALPKMLEKVSTSNDCITAIHMSKKVPLFLLKPSMVQYVISGAKDIWPHGEDTPAELHGKNPDWCPSNSILQSVTE